MMKHKPVVAVFDFDHTLIRRDTMWDFLLFISTKTGFAKKIILISPNLLFFALGLVGRSQAKEKLLGQFFTGLDSKKLVALCADYANRLDTLSDPAGIDRIEWHQKQGHQVLIISASAEDWIQPWALRHGIKIVLATQLERKEGKLTGRLKGVNCHGAEKVRRLLEVFPEREDYELYAYGDGASDMALFEIADHVFKKRFI